MLLVDWLNLVKKWHKIRLRFQKKLIVHPFYNIQNSSINICRWRPSLQNYCQSLGFSTIHVIGEHCFQRHIQNEKMKIIMGLHKYGLLCFKIDQHFMPWTSTWKTTAIFNNAIKPSTKKMVWNEVMDVTRFHSDWKTSE